MTQDTQKKWKEKIDKTDWVEITNENCPTLEKFGVKPFKIMKRKMRDSEGNVWNNINYYDAKKEAEKLGYRLPTENEMKALQEHYKNTQTKVSIHDKEFLGIEELSYDEDVCYEWIEGGFVRGGYWYNVTVDGAFALVLGFAPSFTYNYVGFRCASDHVEISESKESSKDIEKTGILITDSPDFDYIIDQLISLCEKLNEVIDVVNELNRGKYE